MQGITTENDARLADIVYLDSQISGRLEGTIEKKRRIRVPIDASVPAYQWFEHSILYFGMGTHRPTMGSVAPHYHGRRLSSLLFQILQESHRGTALGIAASTLRNHGYEVCNGISGLLPARTVFARCACMVF